LIFKKFLLFLSLTFLVFFVGCGIDFEQHYNKIDNDMVRPISYQFRNIEWRSGLGAEAAPGDTVFLDVFFTGERIDLSDITWKANWNIFTDEFGRVAPRGNDVNLEIIAQYIMDTMGGQMVSIVFVIPEDILHKADVIPNDLTELQRIFNLGDFTNIEWFPALTKKDGLEFLETIAKDRYLKQQVWSNFQLLRRVDGLAQILSAMFEIYLYIPNTPRTVIRHTARWHGRILMDRGALLNFGMNFNPNPPFLDFRQGPNRIGNSRMTVRFSLSDHQRFGTMVDIDFPAADRFFTLEQAFSTNAYIRLSAEDFRLRIFYSSSIHGKIEIEGSSLVNMASFWGHQSFAEIIKIQHDKVNVGDRGWIWVVIFDECAGVANFPQGRNIVGIPVEFVP